MRKFEQAAALAGVAIIAATTPLAAVAQEMEVSVETRLRGTVEYLSFSHDASAADPTWGDPTSTLAYAPLYTASVELVMSGREEQGNWFDLMIGVPIASSGEFIDRDYNAGQSLFQESYSDARVSGVGDVRLRVGLPAGNLPVSSNTGWRPYLTAGGRFPKYTVLGARCTVGCTDLSADITVIDQQILSLDAGLGLWLEQQLSPRETLDIRMEMTAGYFGVVDSHYFRFGDLGPVPNIFYDFATATLYGEATYTLEATDDLDLTLGAFGLGRIGYGGATFNAAAGGQSGPFPAWSFALSAGVTAGLRVSF